MIYLSQLLDAPIIDASGTHLGKVEDVAISTAEVFPLIVSVSFRGANQTPSIFSWRRFVAAVSAEDGLRLNVAGDDLEYSYLKEDELLLARDLLAQQIVDVPGKKVVRVADLKLSEIGATLRLLGALVTEGGELKQHAARLFGRPIPEQLIAWNYIDLPGRDLSQLKLSVSHKRLHELHPADVADIIEQLDPAARAAVFAHLDKTQAAETISEMEDEYQANVIEDLPEDHASDLLAEMDPDDAADIIADLDATRAERLLRLMGYEDSETIRSLLGYAKQTAGGIMTPEVAIATATMTVKETRQYLRQFARDADDLHYVYLVDTPETNVLTGVVTLFQLLMHDDDTPLSDFATTDLITANPDDDQEDVADLIAKYNLLALPVTDASGRLLGTVTVDDALDVREEEAEEDLARATGQPDPDSDRSSNASSDRSTTLRRAIRSALRALRWAFPQSLSWVVIWIVATTLAYWFSTQLMTVSALAENNGTYALAFASLIATDLCFVLPLGLTTIRSAVLRAIGMLTDQEPNERPSTTRLYFRSLGIALVGSLALTAVSTLRLSVDPANGGVDFSYTAAFFISTLLAAALTALFTVRNILATVRDDDRNAPISPRRVATLGMLIFIVAVTVITVLVCYNLVSLGLLQF
ncbi:MAG: CBS domain-containing protein [Actinomycetes bacterium]|jgi:CBS domain-containing protein/sporulation protein YlmC with PRC-barrel domain|nr:CBS domain-containing protein [Actinomycetes bacterium]